jgi:glycosyltransferase involved in cell wall biosynthesis
VEFPEVEVVYHGRPAFKETDQSIGEEIARNDASGRITYAGPVYGEAKWKALAEADIFCFPSFHEAFPMAVLEAMATGLPIVATRVGAVADAVQDGSGGELVPPGDIREMASALRRLIINPRLRREFGAFNQERFQEKYTLLAYQQRWLAWMQRCS